MLPSEIPDMRALQLLAVIARTRSITVAATELGITQQAASRRLQRLESELGFAVVSRSTRSSELTEIGRALLNAAAPLLHAASTFEAEARRILTEDRQVRVASSLTIAEHLLPRWIAEYTRRGGDARHITSVATNTSNVIHAVTVGDAELGFVEGAAPPPGLQYRFMAADELGVYVSVSHPWAARHHVDAWTLAHTPLVTRESGSGCQTVLRATLTAHGVTSAEIAEPVLKIPSNTAVLEAASSGVAPAVMSTIAADPYEREGRLVRIVVRGVELRREFGAVWLNGAEPASREANRLLLAAREAAV